MTIDGYLATQVVPGLFNSLEFYDFIQEEVVCLQIVYEFLYLLNHLQLPEMNPFPAE